MALTLRQLCFVSREHQPSVNELTNILGLKVGYKDPEVIIFGLENSLMPIGTNFFEIVSPVQENTPAEKFINRRGGDGGYMIITQADSLEYRESCRQRALDMGIRVAWEGSLHGAHWMQLHPADVGGSFFEIDWEEKNEHEGNWIAAGGVGWKDHVKTDVTVAIKGAELQSPDPEALAKRWSRIADLPLEKDEAGRLQMQLKNAVIRFVKDQDGRGPGLGGVDIQASAPEKIIKAAEDMDLKISDSQVMICGVRFNLV